MIDQIKSAKEFDHDSIVMKASISAWTAENS